ncbi:MAG: hypothetical protein HY701_12940, partial [Gemmatimonadetes bacterium]|nr:hypothetical protein [Gemmatimonadota bacterium]
MTRTSQYIAFGAVAAVVAYCAVSVYILSASLTPSRDVCPPGSGPPSELQVEPVAFNSRADGIRLAGWAIPSPGDHAVVLIHGIDSDAWAGAALDLARTYHDAGFEVLLFDLRAHGRSEGERVTLGRLERGDVAAAVDLLL